MLFKIVENNAEENEKTIDRVIDEPDFGKALEFFINNYSFDNMYQSVTIDLKNSTASMNIGYYTDYDTDTVLMPADDSDYMGKKTPYYE